MCKFIDFSEKIKVIWDGNINQQVLHCIARYKCNDIERFAQFNLPFNEIDIKNSVDKLKKKCKHFKFQDCNQDFKKFLHKNNLVLVNNDDSSIFKQDLKTCNLNQLINEYEIDTFKLKIINNPIYKQNNLVVNDSFNKIIDKYCEWKTNKYGPEFDAYLSSETIPCEGSWEYEHDYSTWEDGEKQMKTTFFKFSLFDFQIDNDDMKLYCKLFKDLGITVIIFTTSGYWKNGFKYKIEFFNENLFSKYLNSKTENLYISLL